MVNKTFLVSAVFLAMATAGGASAAEGKSASQLASEVCSKCHGPDGMSQSPMFPRLAGQQAEYIEQQLRNFRDRSRGDPHAQAYMWGIAGPLNDSQIQELARYYAGKRPTHGTAPSDYTLAEKGKEIFHNGVPSHEIPVCAGCHGDHAEGQGPVPRLAGQHFDYLYRQLRDFRSELRVNETMHTNVMHMSDDEAAAVSAYLASQ